MISIIVAIANDGVIGGDNRLLWHISEDLRRFKAITTAHPVVMGRKTWESLGRPLPNRENIVITRNRDYVAQGARVVGSLEQAVELFSPEQEIFVIGGGEIYRQALLVAEKLYITKVKHNYLGDTAFPEIDTKLWLEVSKESFERGEKFEYPFEFIDYKRV